MNKQQSTAQPLADQRLDFPALEGLNPPQRAAVLTTEGPLLVLAGAGTGKTRVLTTRLAYLLFSGKSSPARVLAVTFTNKAAQEMRGRIQALLHHNIEGFWLGTFHSLCVRILRRHAERLEFTRDFTILDVEDQLRLLKQIIKAENLDEKVYTPKLAAAYIGKWKDQLVRPASLSARPGSRPQEKTFVYIYQLYQQRLKTLNAMDFGDLLFHTLTLFQDHPEVLHAYQEQFDYILVDEYQDTNTAQYLWLRLLAQRNKNICCVGDDDQSIYGWRGAEVKNILQFEKDFPGAKVVRLEQNYRSTSHILNAASAVIANNDKRLGKTLWTDAGQGDLVTVNTLWSGVEEAAWVTDEVEAHYRKGTPYKEMAILVRAGYQTREFEERFLNVGIPYRVIGGLRFYERMEIRDALAYFRVVSNPTDSLAFERILNVPKRGIGPSALVTLHELARAQGVGLYEAAHTACQELLLKGKARLSMLLLLEQLSNWKNLGDKMPHPELAQLILEESGYIAMWQGDKSEQAQGRLENLKELISALREYPSLPAFLEHVSLVMDMLDTSNQDLVTIMTLHSAKGLEFDVVFLAGWEEGVFPSQRTLEETGQQGLEEERRLAYVGLTRAKRKAYVSCVKNRTIYGSWQAVVASRFIAELPAENIDDLSDTGRYANPSFERGFEYEIQDRSQGWSRKAAVLPPGQGVQSKIPFKKQPVDGFVCGARVNHETYGEGTVLAAEEDRLDIFFTKAGRKKILKQFVTKV